MFTGVLAGRSVRSVLAQTEKVQFHQEPRTRDVLLILSRAVHSSVHTVHHRSAAAVTFPDVTQWATTVVSSCRPSVLRCLRSTVRRTFLRVAGRCSGGNPVPRLTAVILRSRYRPARVGRARRADQLISSLVDLVKVGIWMSPQSQGLYITCHHYRRYLHSSIPHATRHLTFQARRAVHLAVDNSAAESTSSTRSLVT